MAKKRTKAKTSPKPITLRAYCVVCDGKIVDTVYGLAMRYKDDAEFEATGWDKPAIAHRVTMIVDPPEPKRRKT